MVSLCRHEFLPEEHLAAQSVAQSNVAMGLQLFIPHDVFPESCDAAPVTACIFHSYAIVSYSLLLNKEKRKTLPPCVTFPVNARQGQKGDQMPEGPGRVQALLTV